MGDWQELAQTAVLGLIFSYLLAKLISTVVHFREHDFRVVREDNPLLQQQQDEEDEDEEGEEEEEEEEGEVEDQSKFSHERATTASPSEHGGGEGKLRELSEQEEENDDWEGVESTELDEMFSAATAFVAATAADRSAKVSNDVQLELYGLYKIATEGPCTTTQPSALKMTARAKWNAWQRLGSMPPEEAMERYILTVTELYPSWTTGTTRVKNQEETKRPMGPVFSSFIHEEEFDTELTLEDIHVSAREGNVEELKRHMENGISVNLRDSEGRTPLHWAVDRGHLPIVEILVNSKANVNAMDNEGQTPLHYAVLCERESVAEILVKHGASCFIKDNDGISPFSLGGDAWSFLSSDES